MRILPLDIQRYETASPKRRIMLTGTNDFVQTVLAKGIYQRLPQVTHPDMYVAS